MGKFHGCNLASKECYSACHLVVETQIVLARLECSLNTMCQLSMHRVQKAVRIMKFGAVIFILYRSTQKLQQNEVLRPFLRTVPLTISCVALCHHLCTVT